MERRFEGKVALVTGAATGIGQAAAVRLAAEGAVVAVNHRPGQDPGPTLAQISEAGGQGFGVAADMRQPGEVTAMVREVASRAGRLDCVASNAAVNPFMAWDETAYCGTKGAISMLAKALGLDLGEHGIRVNAVEPGWVKTDMSAPLTQDPAALQYYAERVALHRGAEPAELAAAIAWLLCPDASYVTSATLLVDGGFIVNAEL